MNDKSKSIVLSSFFIHRSLLFARPIFMVINSPADSSIWVIGLVESADSLAMVVSLTHPACPELRTHADILNIFN